MNHLIIVTVTALFAVACQQNGATLQNAAASQSQDDLPRVSQIGRDPVHTLLPPDAIPSIDAPQFVGAAEATFMRDEEPVIGIVSGGVAKAFSTWHLDHHEIVNDTIGDKPVAVTW